MVGAASVGAASVVERDRVVKSWRRTLSVTVRPDRPLVRSRSATLVAWRVTSPAIRRGSVRSVS